MEGEKRVIEELLKDLRDIANGILEWCKTEEDCKKVIIPLCEVQSELMDNKYELIKNQGGKK